MAGRGGPDPRMRRGTRHCYLCATTDTQGRPHRRSRCAASGQEGPIEPFDLLFREIQLRFAFLNPFTQARAAELISSSKIAITPLISRMIPLEAAAATIAGPPAPGEVKVLVVPS